MRDDHRTLAVHTTRSIAVMTAVLGVALLATGRAAALSGLVAGATLGLADVYLLSRSLTRFGAGTLLNPRALGTGMFTRFLSVAVLLGLLLCVRGLNPLAALIGFLLMPASVALVGSRWARHGRVVKAVDARG